MSGQQCALCSSPLRAGVAHTCSQAVQELRSALRFIHELAGECMDNGDVRVGTAAEVAMRHIWRRAEDLL